MQSAPSLCGVARRRREQTCDATGSHCGLASLVVLPLLLLLLLYLPLCSLLLAFEQADEVGWRSERSGGSGDGSRRRRPIASSPLPLQLASLRPSAESVTDRGAIGQGGGPSTFPWSLYTSTGSIQVYRYTMVLYVCTHVRPKMLPKMSLYRPREEQRRDETRRDEKIEEKRRMAKSD